MDNERAQALLQAERARVESLLAHSLAAADEDRASENMEIAISDAAEPLTAEGVENAVVAQLRERLDAVRRAEDRLRAGSRRPTGGGSHRRRHRPGGRWPLTRPPSAPSSALEPGMVWSGVVGSPACRTLKGSRVRGDVPWAGGCPRVTVG